MHRYLRHFFCATAFPLLCGSASALTLDWGAAGVTWTNPGSFAGNPTISNSYDVGGNPGNDVTVSISGNTAQFGNTTPAINTNLQGGYATAPKALNLYVDFTSQAQFVTIGVSFAASYTQGMSGVSFTIFDVDGVNSGTTTSFQDKISSIIGIAPDGSQVAATITLTANTVNTVTGNGTLGAVVLGNGNSPNTGAGSDVGNVTVSFASAIQSFSFVYGSGTNTIADPTAQQISISNISFTPVPEINPAWTGLISCLAASGLVLRHRSLTRKK
ncbi:MAG: hypothetical protein M3032_05825 [Verrucomicrobiota bacterium]|nr:hypothetical protein [Verrucomicrobiota bacterium]